jgi:DNA-binding NarL/FixJ family response regulator
VVVIDDHELLGSSLVVMMARHGFDVRRIPIGTPEVILSQVGSARRGVALLDLDLGPGPNGRRLSGLDLLTPLRARGWESVIMTGSGREDDIAAGVAAGAAGLVTKASSAADLVGAVSTVLDGAPLLAPEEREKYLQRAQRATARRRASQARLHDLSDRELQVLRHLGDGHRATAIAEEFCTSISTVRSQIRSILHKLGVGSQLEAVAHLHAAQET